MRSWLLGSMVLAFCGLAGTAAAQPQERAHIGLVIGGERHFSTFIGERPASEGAGEEPLASRLWSGGFDLCAAAVVRPWLDLGVCLGLHVISGLLPDDELDPFIADQSPAMLARMMLSSTFRSPKWVRGGIDIGYRSFISDDRESAFEMSFRFGFEHTVRGDVPLFLEAVFRAPLFTTRSESTYNWPLYDGDELIGYEGVSTRDVRILTVGIQAGTYWSIR